MDLNKSITYIYINCMSKNHNRVFPMFLSSNIHTYPEDLDCFETPSCNVLMSYVICSIYVVVYDHKVSYHSYVSSAHIKSALSHIFTTYIIII